MKPWQFFCQTELVYFSALIFFKYYEGMNDDKLNGMSMHLHMNKYVI